MLAWHSITHGFHIKDHLSSKEKKTKEWHMTHPDGRTATFPEAREVAGGTLSSMIKDIGITRRAFVEAAERAGILSKKKARDILNR